MKGHLTPFRAYTPNLDADETTKDRFCDFLEQGLRGVNHNDLNKILGDFKACAGKAKELCGGVIGPHGVGNNNNGLRLLSLCTEHDLVITNTLIQLKNRY